MKIERKLYSDLLQEAFLDGYEYAQREFTKYDETDTLKRMNDADILAEKKKPTPGKGEVASAALTGAIGGAVVGGVAGGLRGGFSKSPKRTFAKGLKRGGKWGALIGGGILAAKASKKNQKARDDAKFYNHRLEYAQRQAKRREKKDWHQNMTQREGYSY